MAFIHIRHRVEDYAKWKNVFDQAAAFKQSFGWKNSSIYAVGGDARDVLVIEEFASLQQAQSFMAAPDLKAAMQQAGVSSPPEVLFLEQKS